MTAPAPLPAMANAGRANRPRRLRPLLMAVHRYAGLATALFLFVAGLTGAVISWDHELDEWLNPQLFQAPATGSARTPLELAAQLEKADPRLQVTWLPLAIEPGHSLLLSVEPRPDPSGQPAALAFNQVALDPASGKVLGTREWGAVSLARENLLPFLYKLHYSLHLPMVSGIDTGMWLMGLIAIVWVLDSVVALWISFPARRVWRKSFAFRWRQGGHALNYDVHRSGGVWVWPLLLVLAVTSVSMNLGNEVVRPLVAFFSPLHGTAFDTRAPLPEGRTATPALTREQVLARATAAAAKRGWQAPAGAIYYAPEYDLYGVGFFVPGEDHGDSGLGNPWLYFDAATGVPAGAEIPGSGSAGDIFMQAQFPLHSGRILGLPGRVLISTMGLAMAALSATGIVIWARKRRFRLRGRVHARMEP